MILQLGFLIKVDYVSYMNTKICIFDSKTNRISRKTGYMRALYIRYALQTASIEFSGHKL